MPFAFDAVSRAIIWEVRRLVAGPTYIFVDDLFGAAPAGTMAPSAVTDCATAEDFVRALLGSEAVAEKKRVVGPRVDIIGYDVDCGRRLVAVSRRNALKALYGFFSVDFDQPIPFDALEQLASWGSRYAQICRILEPFTVVLYAELRGRHRAGVIQWTAELRTAVELFRSLLSMSVLRRAQFSRTLDSFRENAPLSSNCYLVEYDASLTGFGILLYKWVPGLQQWAPFGGSPPINIASWGWAGKPEFQNTAEFMACAVGVALLLQHKVDISTVSLRGDSVTAGRWGFNAESPQLDGLEHCSIHRSC
jgi:hypothetical protein